MRNFLHFLNNDQKRVRIQHAQNITHNDLNFLKIIVMGDKISCFQYEPPIKCQNLVWKTK